MFAHTSEQLAENKLSLLYILHKINLPLTNSQITELILGNDLMNFFMLQQYISELKEVEFIKEINKDNQELFVITDKGKNTLEFFINRIPKETKERIDNLIKEKKNDIIKSTQVKAYYTKNAENDFIVNLAVVEKDTQIIGLSINVANANQAKEICNNWNNQSESIYGSIIKLLTNKNSDS